MDRIQWHQITVRVALNHSRLDVEPKLSQASQSELVLLVQVSPLSMASSLTDDTVWANDFFDSGTKSA
jgi:hypothetical protein